MRYQGSHRTQRVRLAVLALAMAAAALLAVTAQAQSPAGDPPLTFSYRDANGEGRLAVLDLGEDRATGGRRIQVTLTQRGARYTGSGITLPLEQQMPFRTLISFALERRRGATLYYRGITISGITLSGHGTYHPVGAPDRLAEWSIVLGGPPPTGSGIRGLALLGPISPVERPGIPNERPFPGAIITVQPEGGGREIARRRTDRDGRFEIPLPPGTYLIVPLPPNPGVRLPRGERQTVRVEAGRFTEVVIRYDTGIR